MIGLPTIVSSRMSLTATPGLARHLGGERIECAAHRLGHLLRAARMHHRVGDAAHQVLAEADLRVHEPAGGDHLAGLKVAQVTRRWWWSRRRPRGRRCAPEARPDADDAAAARARPPSPSIRPCAGSACSVCSTCRSHVQSGELPFALAAPSASRCRSPDGSCMSGSLHLDVVQTYDRIERDRARLGRLAHHLAVHLAARRHVDDEVALDLCRAGEAVPGWQRAAAREVLLGRARTRTGAWRWR